MLQVSKDGATELGRGSSFHMRESKDHSVPVGSLPFPNITPMLLRLNMTQLPVSVWLRSCAWIWVYDISSIWKVCRKIVSDVFDIFFTRTRSGMGSLQVRMEGFGNLVSAETRGAYAWMSWSDPETFWNNVFVLEVLAALENWCWRLAYVSWPGLPGRGGSIGRNFKAVVWNQTVSYYSKRICKTMSIPHGCFPCRIAAE